MEYKNKQVYIVCHNEACETGEELKAKLAEAGIAAEISCGNTFDQINAAVISSDAAVFVLTENFEKEASLKSIVNQLTGKPTISYFLEDVTLESGMKYFLEKTRKIEGSKGSESFVEEVKKLLEDTVIYKDVTVITNEKNDQGAQRIIKELQMAGLSGRVEDINSDLSKVIDNCGTLIMAGVEDGDNVVSDIVSEAKKRHKSVFIYSAEQLKDEKKTDKLTEKAIRDIKKKKTSHTILTDNIGGIKLLKRPWTKVIMSAVFVQLAIFIVWLASMHDIYYGLGLPVIVGVFVFLLLKERKKCACTKCKNNHNGGKVKVIAGKKEIKYEFKFCDTHAKRKDVSANSKINLYMAIVLAAVTLGFTAFIIVADVQFEDFTFLDIRRKIELSKPAEFEDAGFEAFIRNQLHLGEAPISRESLLEVQALNFDANKMTVPINSLKDLEYFPNLRVFECGKGAEIYGDFSSFTYTPKLKTLDIGFTEIGGDIASLAGLSELKELIKNEDNESPKENIYGDVSALQNLDLHVIKLHHTNVYGDISFASNMQNLFWIRMPYTSVSGDISSLPDGMLGIVDLAQTDVTGDIAAFAGENMIAVDLSETNVYGDISVFEGMQDLMMIRFPYCDGVTGDLSSIRNIGRLENVEVDYTGVYGDIGEINALFELRVFKATDTRISGDVAAFSDKNNLVQIYLNGCRGISGDIGVFSGLENLEQLGLRDTGVSGNAWEFYNNPKISDLNLDGTNVYSEEENQRNGETTLKSIGFDDEGNLQDSTFGVSLKIESKAFDGITEEAFYCSLRVREKKFDVKIIFPSKTHEITFDGKTYQYIPMDFEVVSTDFDVESALAEYVGGDINSLHDEIVCAIDNYCNGRFGYNVDALMEMKYE